MSFCKEPDAQPLPGYRLIEPLGNGGFGEVWKCEVPGGLFKAIKFIYGNLNAKDVDSARAEQEFEALNRVKEVRHPFVLSMERIEVLDGEVMIVMELADKSLHDVFVECQAAGRIGIPRDDLLRYMRDAAEALDHMIEKHNLLHLDVKPRNLFVIADRVKVADFGLVKNVDKQSGALSSVTPLYAPPETFTGKISPHSDQYSLAIVYQELLTGQRPFNGKNARQLLLQHTKEEPELRNLPEAERPVVARALAKDPDKRFPNCLSFVRGLYIARTAKPEPIILQPESGKRSKNMSETMEDVMLEQVAVDSGEAPSPLLAAGLEPVDISQLGITINQPDSGALRPTLVIGIGGYGRRALSELRCRFTDRFGDMSRIPLLRFMYIDTDPDVTKMVARSGAEKICPLDEYCPLPLQTVSNYRRRILDQLNEWMPVEKLYTLPRSLQTQGIRALGRLAFADNNIRLLARVRKEIQFITHADTLYQAVDLTGLALRDKIPRVYVIAAAGGGGSGMTIDLGYGIRRLLAQLNQEGAEVTLLLFCGATDDPATPPLEQANVYAALTELNHFQEPGVRFTAQYGPDSPRIADEGRPYNNVYLLKAPHRSPEAIRDSVAHLSSYLFHELGTPLSLRLDRCRMARVPEGATSFRSFGTYAVWFPRGMMLRSAAKQACAKLLREWEAGGETTAKVEVDAACAKTLAAPEFRFEAMCSAIEKEASAAFGEPLAAALTSLLASLEEQIYQPIALDDPGNWATRTMHRVSEWVGTGTGSKADIESQKSQLSRALNLALQKVVGHWDKHLAEIAFGLMEHPGRRVATSEAAINRFVQFIHERIAEQRPVLEQQKQKTLLAREQLEKALDNCITGQGGFSFFGGKQKRLLRVFMDHLAAFGRQCLTSELGSYGVMSYASLRGKMDDRVRELSFCRQRLRPLVENLNAPDLATEDDPANYDVETTPAHVSLPSAESYWEAISKSETVFLVLPEGEVELESAATRFLARLTNEQWSQLDQALQDRLLAPLGGLHKVCVTGCDLSKSLSGPLIVHAAECLGELLPITDVADVEMSAAKGQGMDIGTRMKGHFENALPLVASKTHGNQHSFLLIPTSDAGKELGDIAKEAIQGLELVRVPGQTDLMFCREQGSLTVEDLHRLLRPCHKSYEEGRLSPTTSPHARFDVTDWLPVDP